MAALIVAASHERPVPTAILVVTDGYTGWPPKPVGPRVVACLTRSGTADSVPKWIEAIVLTRRTKLAVAKRRPAGIALPPRPA